MKRVLVKTARLIHKYYGFILVTAAVSSVIFVFLISNIEMKTDLMDVMPAGDPSMKLFSETLNDLQKINALTIVVDAGGPEIERHTDIIETLGQKLKGSSLIRDVDYSVFNMPWQFMFKHFPVYLDDEGVDMLVERTSAEGIRRQIRQNYHTLASPLSTPAEIKLITSDPLDLRSLLRDSAVKKNSYGMDINTGYYISNDGTAAFIFVTPDGSSRDISFVNSLRREVKEIVDATLKERGGPGGISIGYTGGYAVSWEAHESIRRDVMFSAMITVILILIIFMVVYRINFAAVTVIFITIAMALLLTLTCAYVLFGSLNLVTALVSAMLIGLGIDYTLHVYDRYSMEFSRDRDRLRALETTLSNTGRSVVTSGLTTAFAFSSIVVTSFRGLHELGIIAGIGIIACMLSTILILGSFLMWVSSGRFSGLLMQKENIFLEKTVPDFLMRHGRKFLIVLGVAVLFSAAGLLRLGFVSDISQIGLKNSRALALQERLLNKLEDRGMPLIATYTGDMEMEEAFDELEKKLDIWKESGVTGGHNSLGSLVPPFYKQHVVFERLSGMFDGDHDIKGPFISAMKRYGFTVRASDMSYINNVAAALRSGEAIAPGELPEKLRSKAGLFYNKEKHRLSAYLYPPGRVWRENEIETIRRDMNALGGGWHLTGWQLLSADLRDSIIRESIAAAVISFVFIFFMIYLHFRRAVVIFSVQMPLLLGLMLTLGVMGLLGIGFNYINIAAITLIFGISVDYGVYVMQAVSENSGRGDDVLIRHAFKNIIICSLTTMAGFGSLVTTSFRGISSLGSVIIIGIISCLMISISLLPLSERILSVRK